MKRTVWSGIQGIMFSAVGILLLILLVLVGAKKNIDVQQSRPCEEIFRVQDVSHRELEDAAAPNGVSIEYSFLLKDPIPNDTYLLFCVSHHYVTITLDGEEVYRLRLTEGTPTQKTPGNHWVTLPLYREDSGKEVCVVATPVYVEYQGREPEFWIGSPFAFHTMQLSAVLPELTLCLLNILAGVVLLAIAAYCWFTKQNSGNLCSIGLLAITMGLWRSTYTNFSTFLVRDQSSFLYCLSLVALLFLPIPLMKSAKSQLQGRRHLVLDGCCVAVSIISIVQLLLQLLGVADLRESLFITHSTLTVSALLVLGMMVLEWHRSPPNRKFEQIPSWFLCIGVFIDLTLYYRAGAPDSDLLFLSFIIFCFVLIEGARFLFRYTEQTHRLAETELQLAQSRFTTMMSQIRSHFIFNILNAISGMCKYDPQKADETVVCFARYLRSNIDIMQDDNPITFYAALRHLEDYVVLEQIRFGDKIQFVTDITVDQFMVPPLILQPLVENSIKHGLTPKPDGGTVTLRTWETDHEICIAVEDDGVGFNQNSPDRNGAVGLQNVRFRLQHLMHGKLEITSEIGHGTTVTVFIPRKEAEQCM